MSSVDTNWEEVSPFDRPNGFLRELKEALANEDREKIDMLLKVLQVVEPRSFQVAYMPSSPRERASQPSEDREGGFVGM